MSMQNISSVPDKTSLATCAELLSFIDASPTPFHAAAEAAARLRGFTELRPDQSWAELGPGSYFVPVGDGTLVAFVLPATGRGPGQGLRGFRIVGAHTDSPNLRLKPRPAYEKAGYLQLGVEVYGGALLNSWLDRDLRLAGRVVYREAGGGLRRGLVRLEQPIVRVPQLAIHLDRDVNDKGLVLNRQEHLAPILGLFTSGRSRTGGDQALLHELCAQALGIDTAAVVTTELMLHDAQASTRAGLAEELVLAPRLDNLAMSHAAVLALGRAGESVDPDAGLVPLIALFDHEEVGSNSAYGAQAPILPSILERIVLATGGDRERYHQVLAGSLCVSTDMAHAVHPNYLDRHEANHRPVLNGGPVIKSNAQQRYATCARTAALFQELCRRAEVPVQHYAHRTDLPCGSTIGPITATLLGIPTVDVGSAMLSMHSARELAGSADPELMTRALCQFFGWADAI
jgi:aspartyl aminopeptidase